jgi:two-component sensor histidine kinase
MSSLLALQARRLPKEPYGYVFQEARNRIWSMALVHESLHRSSNLSEIQATDYFQRLTQEIYASYRFQGNSADYELDIEDISIRLNTSITCGLIVNELVSNCMKHAFPPGARGKIKVSLHSNGDKELELAVCDNGVGLPKNLNIKNPQTFGFFLINTLVEALQGNLEVSVAEGAEFRIRFEDEFSRPNR